LVGLSALAPKENTAQKAKAKANEDRYKQHRLQCDFRRAVKCSICRIKVCIDNTGTNVNVDIIVTPCNNIVVIVVVVLHIIPGAGNNPIRKRQIIPIKQEITVLAITELIPLADPAPAGVVTASDWASVITAMTSQISVSTVVGVLATLVTAGIGLVFLWWGVRKAVGSLMGSFRSGRIRL
jgi:hypothetical protein